MLGLCQANKTISKTIHHNSQPKSCVNKKRENQCNNFQYYILRTVFADSIGRLIISDISNLKQNQICRESLDVSRSVILTLIISEKHNHQKYRSDDENQINPRFPETTQNTQQSRPLSIVIIYIHIKK